jgi:hypothetical protein
MLSFLRKQESRVSREGGNPVTFCSSLFSQRQVWIPTFVGMTDEVNPLWKATWNYQFKTLKHFAFSEPVFIPPAELGGILEYFDKVKRVCIS